MAVDNQATTYFLSPQREFSLTLVIFRLPSDAIDPAAKSAEFVQLDIFNGLNVIDDRSNAEMAWPVDEGTSSFR